MEVAIRFLENAEATIRELASAPGLGSPYHSSHPELADFRFRRVAGFPKHLIFYKNRPGAIEIVRIIHGARDLDSQLREL